MNPRHQVIAEGTPRVVLLSSLFVAVAAFISALVVGYVARPPWLPWAFLSVWMAALCSFVGAAVVASRRAGVPVWRVMLNAFKAAVWFVFNASP